MKNIMTLFVLALTTGVVSAQLQPIELDIEPMEIKDVKFQGQPKMGGTLSFDWHGPVTPLSHDVDINFTQGGTLLIEVNGVPSDFIPFGMTNPVAAWPLVGSGQLRIKVPGLTPGMNQNNQIEGYLIDANLQQVGYFDICDCQVGGEQVYVFEEPDMYFTSDPVDPNDLSVDKPVWASGYGLSQVTNRENRVRYWVIDPLGNQVNFPYQVPFPQFGDDELHFPFWAFVPGNYTICASYNHADIGLPAHFGETVIIPSTCLTFPHNGLSTSLGEQHFQALAAKGLFAWPSPVGAGPFTLTSVAAGNLRVVNAMGAVVSLERIQQGDNRLDPSGWGASGVYILALESEDGQGFSTTVVKL